MNGNSQGLTKSTFDDVPVQNNEKTNTSEVVDLITSKRDDDFGINIPTLVKGGYKSDGFFAKIMENLNHYKDFHLDRDVLFLTSNGSHTLCVPDIVHDSRKLRKIILTHGHKTLAHLGVRKTYVYLHERVWWPHMFRDIKSYCESCSNCVKMKLTTQKPMGLLHPLEIPTYPWQAIDIDFMGPLLSSKIIWGSLINYAS